MILAFQIAALFLPKPSTDFLHSASQRYLDIPCHRLVGFAHLTLVPSISDHHFYPLDGSLAIVKAVRDFLSQPFYSNLFLPFHILIIKAW